MLESCSGIYHKIPNSTWPGSGSEGSASFAYSQDFTGRNYDIFSRPGTHILTSRMFTNPSCNQAQRLFVMYLLA